MIIREYSQLDNEQVFNVEKLCFPLENRSLKSLESTAKQSNFVGFVLEENGAIGGFITATYCLDESDIITVAVAPNYQNNGYGFMLIKALENALKSKGVTKIFLEVRRSNLSAIKLYEKANFKNISVRKNYYDGVEDAIIYLLEI